MCALNQEANPPLSFVINNAVERENISLTDIRVCDIKLKQFLKVTTSTYLVVIL